ncbi:hypothetical protein NIES4102_31760 [Chondrocystis sp. NIES-4102]|nr:hypothetical protein NIES4102_31760 [Chondrocystis sp. NIES-4102]
MTELIQDLSLAQAHSLINSYGFDLGEEDALVLLQCWLDIYDPNWILLATIEALYLGRYKAISIEHILNVWLRLGSPNTHFTYEFERLICRKLPKHLNNTIDYSWETELSELAFEQLETESIDIITTSDRVENKITKKQSDRFWETEAVKGANKSLISNWGIARKNTKNNWSNWNCEDKTIHQFIPLPDVSSFFNKLKTFGEEKLEGQ